MIRFEVNKTYTSDDGRQYTVLNRTNNEIECRFNKIIKKFRIMEYCGVETVIQYGKALIKAGRIKYQFDEELDGLSYNRKTMNKKPMGYLDVIRNRRK